MSLEIPSLTGALIKDGIVLFWAAWISIVVVANVVDALRVAGVVPSDAGLASGNYSAIVDVSDTLSVPRWLDFVLFLLIILWEAVSALLLWRGAASYLADVHDACAAADTGLGVLLALFASFMLGDEIFHAFKTETDHRSVAAFILISLIALSVLPG